MTHAPSENLDQPGPPPPSDQSLLCALRVAKDPVLLHEDSDDADHMWQMPRLIWVFAGCTCGFVGSVVGWLICDLPQEHSVVGITEVAIWTSPSMTKASSEHWGQSALLCSFTRAFSVHPQATHKNHFRNPYRTYFFGAYSNFYGTSENFSSIFRIFLIISMLFLYKKFVLKKEFAYLPWDVSGNNIYFFWPHNIRN